MRVSATIRFEQQAIRTTFSALLALLCVDITEAQVPDYGDDVRPILADHCFACHGPDAETRKAGLRLDLREVAVSDGAGRAAIAPGDSASSELIHRITDQDDPMPPKEHGPPLTEEQVSVLSRWIAGGATYERHWSYDAPCEQLLPVLRDENWPRTSIDHFILSALEREDLEPAPRADARTLVRRLHFDLTGLPPTPERVAALAADPSLTAWDAMIEELLASPHHAERLTTHWFDLVRFADTTGIHADNRWNISPYRDWVLHAFQSNMPFDQFTIEQVAGDLLPDATREQQVAAAYNRLNLITREGGSQPKEFLIRYTADRVRNLSEVWLASTIGCAECHDHKFDPITTREFYELGAFFADIEQVGVYSQSGRNNFLPELPVPSQQQDRELEQLERSITQAEAALNRNSEALEADQLSWESNTASGSWTTPDGMTFEASGDAQAEQLPTGAFLASSGTTGQEDYSISFPLPTKSIHSIRLELLPSDSLPQQGPGRSPNGNLVLSEFEVFIDDQSIRIVSSAASYEQPNYPVANAHDGKRDRTGWAVMKNGAGAPSEAVFHLEAALPTAVDADTRQVKVVMHQRYGGLHAAGHWRISWSTQQEVGPIAPELRALLAAPRLDRSADELARLRAAHRAQTPLMAEDRQLHKRLLGERKALQAAIPLVLHTHSVDPMVTRVLPRGNWMDETGDIVSPGVPKAFGLELQSLESSSKSPGESGALTRLNLARWLVDKRNPLVARVFVNRLWRMLMGRGLAASMDDFGVQGTQPSHPKLLDHLAHEFVASGWDVRSLLRRIVRSEAYAQRSDHSEARDPGNHWFGRQDRYRLDAEFIRDNALAVSGLLARDFGGASVMPYQPAGYWEHLNFPKRSYMPSTGKQLYRRALYGHWQRQYLHPSLMAFDAPSRERCTAERSRSNTPQAALALLNDPIFVEAARALAQELLQSSSASDAQRTTWLWQRVLQRDPTANERALIVGLVHAHVEHFTEHPQDALALLSTGESQREESLLPDEHAAWTSAARVVLNLHETIVRP
ncbi:MAG: hypothetical protein ACI841_000314 [Planctomycetota bacterium]|jgi:hypothetical protein